MLQQAAFRAQNLAVVADCVPIMFVRDSLGDKAAVCLQLREHFFVWRIVAAAAGAAA